MNYDIKSANNHDELYAILDFAERIFGKHDEPDRTVWEERMKAHPELIIYAEANGKMIGITPSFLEDNGNVTVGIVAVDKNYRKQGIAKALMLEVENHAKLLGVHLIALGSVDTAEGFYQKIGYTGQLLIQSKKHTVEELLALNPGYPVAFTNVYQGKVNQLCLKLDAPDRELQRVYESTLDECYTQTMFWKKI